MTVKLADGTELTEKNGRFYVMVGFMTEEEGKAFLDYIRHEPLDYDWTSADVLKVRDEQ